MKRVVAFLLALVLAFPTYALATGTQYEVEPLVNYVNDGIDIYMYTYGKADGNRLSNVTYNAFQFIFMYDPSKLDFKSAEVFNASSERQLESKTSGGTLIVSGCGEDVNSANSPVILHFTTKSTGTTQVRLVEALVSERSSVKLDAVPAIVSDSTTCKNGVLTITTGSFGVTLQNDLGLFGDTSVASNGTYTFRGSPYYDYELTAKMGGREVNIKSNTNGTFSIENVTGALEISGNRTPKSYSVTVTGSGKEDVTAAATATYGSDYTFSINKKALADYAVTATVDGRAVAVNETISDSTITYTIAGSQITGDITITVSKAAQAGTTLVIFSGNGADDLLCGREYTANSNQPLQVVFNRFDNDYDYCVTVNGRELAIVGSCFTIPKEYLTGSILAVTVIKTAKIDMTVEVRDYSPLSGGQRAYLITAKNNGTAQAGQGFAYNGTPMYYSEKYSAFALVIAASKVPTVETVKSKLTVSTAGYTSVTYNNDVNDSGKLDVNDAQLVYDMILSQYAFSGLDQMMWLRADSNGDKTLNVLDVQTVLQAIA